MKPLLEQISDNLREQLLNQTDKIVAAYFDNEDEITISLSAKIKGGNQGVSVKTSVSFVESRVRDERLRIVDPAQLQLFDDKPALGVTK